MSVFVCVYIDLHVHVSQVRAHLRTRARAHTHTHMRACMLARSTHAEIRHNTCAGEGEALNRKNRQVNSLIFMAPCVAKDVFRVLRCHSN